MKGNKRKMITITNIRDKKGKNVIGLASKKLIQDALTKNKIKAKIVWV